MKILFVMRDDGDMTEPMGIMLLSALAKAQGHETDLWVIERDDIGDTIKRTKPDVVAFSVITGSHRGYIDAAQRVKKLRPEVQTVFGGPHFTFFPGEIMVNPQIDFVCVGEGDDAWPELLSALENNGRKNSVPNIITKENAEAVLEPPDEKTLERLGLAGRPVPHDRLSLSGKHMRPRRQNLDNLPFMDRGLIYNNTEFINRYKRTLMASRGCPFRCTYCFENQWYDLYKKVGGYRREWYSVDRFLDELEYIKKNWDTRFFKFYDDVMLPFPHQGEIAWHQEFCSKYPKRIGLPFHLLTRCDLVVALKERMGIDVIRDWKQAGMESITMSIESGNAFVRDHVILRDMSGAEVKKAFSMAYEAKVYTFPNVILGIPAPLIPDSVTDPAYEKKLKRVGEEVKILQSVNNIKLDLEQVLAIAKQWFKEEEDRREYVLQFLRSTGMRSSYSAYDRESVRFTLDRQPGFPEFPILAPFPKTTATDWCIARGDFDGDYDKLHASYQHRSPLTCFSEQEKTIQQNLALLGSFLTLFAGSRNKIAQLLDRPMRKICIDWLSEFNHPLATKFFGWLYAVSKAYMHRTRIYPIKYTWREKLRFYGQMVSLDRWKQFRKKRTYRGERPGQTLGGPASI